MDDVFNKEENQKNIYVIKHRLAELHKFNGHWRMNVGDFEVVIGVSRDKPQQKSDSVVLHETLNVSLYETCKSTGHQKWVDLCNDSRFKNHQPIQYNVMDTPTGGRINFSDGTGMPLVTLCELIRYLYRLSNLTAFL